MKDINRFLSRFRQFGGMHLVWQYARMGVLGTAVNEVVRCVVTGRSVKGAYPVVTRRIDRLLIERYGKIRAEKTGNDNSGHADKVWFCWLQGMDRAPEMVRVCLQSQQRLFGEDRVVVLNASNYRQWVTLPDYIEEKYKKGIIPDALFSDLLRLELLIRYGGTWIDSTVLADPAARHDAEDVQWKPTVAEIMGSELFVFRYLKNGRVYGMSNWFIHACPANTLLMDVREMLLAYWRDYDCTVNYYIFHLFFGVAARRYPEMMARMPRGNSYHALLLRDRLAADFDAAWWQKLTTHVCFHKLNYRLEAKAKANANSFWNYILNNR